MEMFLNASSRIKDIKRAFNTRFPYLKLEFFSKKHLPGIISPTNQVIPEQAKLIDVTGVMREGEIEITAGKTVSQIERLFQEKFNLPVQVFRRTRSDWVETTRTDSFTLGKQNRMGKEESHAIYDTEVLL